MGRRLRSFLNPLLLKLASNFPSSQTLATPSSPSMATRMWTPAASRFVDTVHIQDEYHRSTGIPRSAVYDESLGEELHKVGMVLWERKLELDEIHAEMKRVAKRFAVAIFGLPLLAGVLALTDEASSTKSLG